MKNLFKNMDLYKAIIIACVVLMPVAGFWVHWLGGRLQEAREAVQTAMRPRTGHLQYIGMLLKQVENMKKNQGRAMIDTDPRIYFDRQIRNSVEGGTLSRNDFRIREDLTPKVIQKLNARDTEIDVEFRRDNKPFPMSRELINAILYNIEAQSPVWRLRNLTVKNEELKALAPRSKTPPPEVSDQWLIEKATFAKREPDQRRRQR